MIFSTEAELRLHLANLRHFSQPETVTNVMTTDVGKKRSTEMFTKNDDKKHYSHVLNNPARF